jgi:hypothetical protein
MGKDTDDLFTEPPWSADVAGIIYAVNGQPGQTTVATLKDDAPAELLAAAPNLLYAVREAMECIDREIHNLPPSEVSRKIAEARNLDLYTAVFRATGNISRAELENTMWTINPHLPPDERKANARLLSAADGLLKAADVWRYLGGYAPFANVASLLREAIMRARPL